MAFEMDALLAFGIRLALLWVGSILVLVLTFTLKCLYNISPMHPLYKYPGPLSWRASRLYASYHHAHGDLYQHIATIHAQYGATVRIAPDELSFTSPEAWSQIYNSRPQLEKSRYHFAPGDTGRPESMITADDETHMRLRRLAGPAFLNSGIAEIEPVLQHYTDLLISQLSKASVEGAQNMVEWFLWTLNDVISQLALDQEFQCLEKRRLHEWPSFLMDVLKITATINQFVRFGLPLRALKVMMTKEKLRQQEMFVDTATSAVAERLAREDNKTADDRPDIIGLMLREMKGWDRLSDPEITANSILIVGGGAETTSTCLSATIFHLCKTPRVLSKLTDEIRSRFASSEEITIKAVADIPYLKATIDESLRIFPVASFITPRRTPSQGHVIDGQMIPGHTYVSMGQWFMGRSEKFFDNPREFRPERWLEPDIKTIGPADLQTDQILRPFSLGPRNCIGKLLALAEARLVLTKLLYAFDIELDGNHETWVDDARFYVLWELQPLKVKLTPRVASS